MCGRKCNSGGWSRRVRFSLMQYRPTKPDLEPKQIKQKANNKYMRTLESLKGKRCCRQVKFYLRLSVKFALVLPFRHFSEAAEPRCSTSSAIKLPDTARLSEAPPRLGNAHRTDLFEPPAGLRSWRRGRSGFGRAHRCRNQRGRCFLLSMLSKLIMLAETAMTDTASTQNLNLQAGATYYVRKSYENTYNPGDICCVRYFDVNCVSRQI